jgi:hypothetical protein
MPTTSHNRMSAALEPVRELYAETVARLDKLDALDSRVQTLASDLSKAGETLRAMHQEAAAFERRFASASEEGPGVD